MKFAVFATLFICFSFGAHAQRKGAYQNPSVSYGNATLSNWSQNLINKAQIIPNHYFSGEFDAGYMFNDHHGIIGGVAYSVYHWGALSQHQRHQYGNLLFYYKLVSSRSGRVGLVIDAGIKVGVLFSAQSKRDGVLIYGWEDSRKFYKSMLYSPFFYFALNVPLNRKVDMTVGPVIEYSLNNIYGISEYSANLMQFAVKLGFGVHTAPKSAK